MTQETALTPYEGGIERRKPAEVVADASEQATALMDIVSNQKLYAEIEGKKYLQCEAWEVIGAFNGVSAITDRVYPIYEGDKKVAYEAEVSLWKNGIKVGGAVMSCGLNEFPCRSKEGEAKDKAAKSAAQTWATSKAYRMNFAWVAVLAGYQPTPAEEMMGEAEREHWCPIHDVPFIKKGKMKWYAHKIEGSDKWCNEEKVKKQQPQDQSEETKPEEPESAQPGEEKIPTTLQELYQYVSSKGKEYNSSWLKRMVPFDEAELKDNPEKIEQIYHTVNEIAGWGQEINEDASD